LVLAGFGLLHLASDGFSTRYLFVVPVGHGLVWPLLASYFAVDLGVYLPVLSLLAALGLARNWRKPRMLDLLLLAGLLASALGRAHPGGDDNVRLPGYALLILGSLATLVPLLQAQEAKGRAFLLCSALLLQAGMLVQSPLAHWPKLNAARAFSQLRTELSACAHGGSAVALDHAGLTDMPFLHSMALSDLRTCRDRELGARATASVLRVLAGDAAPRAVALSVSFPVLERTLAEHYLPCGTLASPPMATGYQPGPQRLYRRP
jgi:hypothetical protein